MPAGVWIHFLQGPDVWLRPHLQMEVNPETPSLTSRLKSAPDTACPMSLPHLSPCYDRPPPSRRWRTHPCQMSTHPKSSQLRAHLHPRSRDAPSLPQKCLPPSGSRLLCTHPVGSPPFTEACPATLSPCSAGSHGQPRAACSGPPGPLWTPARNGRGELGPVSQGHGPSAEDAAPQSSRGNTRVTPG